LPGVLLWAIDGRKRLLERGHFVQPASAKETIRDMENSSNPLKPFLDDPKTGNWTGPSVALMAVRDGQGIPHFSVRSRQYRYTLCANGEEELYDHQSDPHEWTNLFDSEEHLETKKELRKELMTLLNDTRVPEGYPASPA